METKYKAAPADGVAPPKPAKPTAGVPAELPAAKGGAGAGAQPKGRQPPAAQKTELEGTCVKLLAEKLQLMASAQAMHDTISSTPEWMAWAKKLQHAIAALRGAGADDFGRRVAFEGFAKVKGSMKETEFHTHLVSFDTSVREPVKTLKEINHRVKNMWKAAS